MAEEEERLLLRGGWSPSLVDKPLSITPAGLSLERRRYLYENICEYCREDVQDLVCPNPTHEPPNMHSEETQAKRQRL